MEAPFANTVQDVPLTALTTITERSVLALTGAELRPDHTAIDRRVSVVNAPLTVAVLGAGVVGQALAAGWVRAGHRVLLGSRTPSEPRVVDAVVEVGAAGALRHADAVRDADVAVVTVPGEQVDALIGEFDGALAGRVAVDATNVVTPGAAMLNHVDALVGAGATVFRTFNSTGWEQLARPVFGNQRADMPYAGPDTPVRDRVERLVADLGFRPVWLGADADAIASTDALARLWFQLVFGRGWNRRLGFRLLTEVDDAEPGRC